MPSFRPDWRIAVTIFVLSWCVVEWQAGNRFQLTLDEGIYLEGAARVAQGQAPYRDFFNFTGPGTFWAFGAIIRIFGAGLLAARLVLSIEIALLGTAIYWLLAYLTSPAFSAATAFVFVTYCVDAWPIYITHRWDSNTYALIALILIYTAATRARRWCWIAGGACAAFAVWTTPPFAAVAALIAAWIAWTSSWRPVRDYSIGFAAPSIAAAGILIYQRAFGSMIRQLLWASSHYGPPNRVPYGYLSGSAPSHLLRLIEYLMPALLPVLAYLGLLVLLGRRRQGLEQNKGLLSLLVVFSAGVLLASLPRLDTSHLLFVSPVFWVLCGYITFSLLGRAAQRFLPVALGVISCGLLASSLRQDRYFNVPVETNAGPVMCKDDDARLLAALVDKISPGDTLFVFPYLPILDFMSGGQNPTHYIFLQPGMMTGHEEAAVVNDLDGHPPRWMLWAQFSKSFWLTAWPNTDAGRLHFPSIETFMQAQYREVLRFRSIDLTLILAERRSSSADSKRRP